MPNAGEEVASQINTDDSFRHQWISVAAYFKSEKRGFQQGKKLDDWLEAEIDSISMPTGHGIAVTP